MALSVNFTSVCYTTVTLVGNDEQQLFRGFLIQARIVADDTTYAGIFGVVDSDNSQLSPCSRNTVSQSVNPSLSAAINFSTALHMAQCMQIYVQWNLCQTRSDMSLRFYIYTEMHV